MGLIVALGYPNEYEANGSLFWDDGESYGKKAITVNFAKRRNYWNNLQ